MTLPFVTIPAPTFYLASRIDVDDVAACDGNRLLIAAAGATPIFLRANTAYRIYRRFQGDHLAYVEAQPQPGVVETSGRRSGCTTEQMLGAPRGSMFVWCNDRLGYPRGLADSLGRKDLMIVGPSWLHESTIRRLDRRSMPTIVVDHATQRTSAMLVAEEFFKAAGFKVITA
jgi:hypothetical protein